MTKKRLTVLAALMAIMMILCVALLAACDPASPEDPSGDKIEETEGLLIQNSDFKVTGSGTSEYPRSITGWTQGKMSSSGSYTDDVIAGAVNLTKGLYEEFKHKWNDKTGDELYNKLLGRHQSKDSDNLMMIYMPEEGTAVGADDAKYGPTAYGMTSRSFTLEKNSYYKLTVDVLTKDIKGTVDKDGNPNNEPGARIYLSSNGYQEFSGIDTKGEWKTFEIYIESPTLSSTSLTIQLGLGKYTTNYTKGLTTGWVFFDNLTLEKVEETETASVSQQWDAAVDQEAAQDYTLDMENEDTFVKTLTMKVPNGRFDFASNNISSSAAPYNWSSVTGNSSENDAAPSSVGYNGVIDVTEFGENYTKYAGSYYAEGGDIKPAETLNTLNEGLSGYAPIADLPGEPLGSSVYMLSQQLMTAQGIRSSQSIVFEKGKYYDLSIWLYTFDIKGAGVTLQLTGKDGKDIFIKGISENTFNYNANNGEVQPSELFNVSADDGASTKGWKQYHFYVKANQFKDFSYNLTLWLGTGGTGENTKLSYPRNSSGSKGTTYDGDGTFSTGWVFFDDVKLSEIDEDDWKGIEPENSGSPKTAKSIDFIAGENDSFKVDLSDEKNLFDDNIANLSGGSKKDDFFADTEGLPSAWHNSYDKDNEDLPYADPSFVNAGSMIVGTANPSDFGKFGLTNPGQPYTLPAYNDYVFMMHSAQNGYFEVASGSFTVEQNHYYRLSMWVKTEDIQSTSGIYVYLQKKDKDGKDEDEWTDAGSFTKINTADIEDNNGWTELTFVIRGAKDESTDMRLKLTLGSGTRYSASTLAKGGAFVTNLSMVEIDHTIYTGTSTGTYVKTVNLFSAAAGESSFSNGSFDSYDYEDENLDGNGNLYTHAGIPENWSISDKTLLEDEDSTLVAGNIKIDPADDNNIDFKGGKHVQQLFGDNEYANNFTAPEGTGPYVLGISGKKNGGDNRYSVGFTSDSFTLSADKYYRLGVWVKNIDAERFSIFLTGEASVADENYYFSESTTHGEWTEYVFYIKVGMTNVSLKLNLWLGIDAEIFDVDDPESSGTVLFDMVTLKNIEEDEYPEGAASTAADEIHKVISFETESFDAISGSVESRKELNSPSGWTGTADTAQEADNTKAGVIYADPAYGPDTKKSEISGDDKEYIGVFGADVTLEDITFTDEQWEDYVKDNNIDLNDENAVAEAEEKLKAEIYADKVNGSWITYDELTTKSGNQMLVINNNEPSAYYYKNKGYTLKADTAYEISVWVRTHNLTEGEKKGAYIELYMGSANMTDKPLIFKAINTAKKDGDTVTDEWMQFKFYVRTQDEDITSVQLRLALGKYISEDEEEEGLTGGYAMFDDVKITTVDDVTFDEMLGKYGEDVEDKDADNILARLVKDSASGGNTDGGDGSNTGATPGFNLEYLWWMIPTILLGIAIIAVLITYVVKKVRKQPAKVKIKAPVETNDNIDQKHDKYDDFKE